MFGFEDKGDDANEGSRWRYSVRLNKFRQDDKPLPWLRHYGWWLLHNCVAHMLLGLFPFSWRVFDFHDWTSRRLNHATTRSFWDWIVDPIKRRRRLREWFRKQEGRKPGDTVRK